MRPTIYASNGIPTHGSAGAARPGMPGEGLITSSRLHGPQAADIQLTAVHRHTADDDTLSFIGVHHHRRRIHTTTGQIRPPSARGGAPS